MLSARQHLASFCPYCHMFWFAAYFHNTSNYLTSFNHHLLPESLTNLFSHCPTCEPTVFQGCFHIVLPASRLSYKVVFTLSYLRADCLSRLFSHCPTCEPTVLRACFCWVVIFDCSFAGRTVTGARRVGLITLSVPSWNNSATSSYLKHKHRANFYRVHSVKRTTYRNCKCNVIVNVFWLIHLLVILCCWTLLFGWSHLVSQHTT